MFKPTHTLYILVALILTSCGGDTTQAPEPWDASEPTVDVSRLVGANPHEPEPPSSPWDEVSRQEGLCRVDTFQQVGRGEVQLKTSELSVFDAQGRLLKRGFYTPDRYFFTDHERDASGALIHPRTYTRADEGEALTPTGSSTEYIRDASGRLSYTLALRSQDEPSGDVIDHVFRYTYDPQGRIAGIEYFEPVVQEVPRADFAPAQLEDESLWWVSQQHAFSYPEAPRVFERWVVGRIRPSPEQPLSSDAAPVLDQRWAVSGQPLLTYLEALTGYYTLSWSPQGQLTTITHALADSPSLTFSHDTQGRLSEATRLLRYDNSPPDDLVTRARVSWRDATHPEQITVTRALLSDEGTRDTLTTTLTFTGPACALSPRELAAHLSFIHLQAGELRLDPNTIAFD